MIEALEQELNISDDEALNLLESEYDRMIDIEVIRYFKKVLPDLIIDAQH